MVPIDDVDVLENTLRKKGDLLDILLKDRTTGRNIIWATDSYLKTSKKSDPFWPSKQIYPDLVTGRNGKLIQPRTVKSKEEQKRRTKDKAEVFTPLRIVDEMNSAIDQSIGDNLPSNHTWQDYVKMLKLEITCGEAPYIVSRYDPTLTKSRPKKIGTRVGFLDKKLEVVSKYCDDKETWLQWAKEAYKASYGYEWQGDNILIARENLLYSLIDYYKDKFKTKRAPSLEIQKEFAEIISWNIWQMDGLKYVVPMSCKHTREVVPGLPLLGEPDKIVVTECPGCKNNDPFTHNGRYAKIKDWSRGKNGVKVKFVELLGL